LQRKKYERICFCSKNVDILLSGLYYLEKKGKSLGGIMGIDAKWQEIIDNTDIYSAQDDDVKIARTVRIPEATAKAIFQANNGDDSSEPGVDREYFAAACKNAVTQMYNGQKKGSFAVFLDKGKKLAHRSSKTIESVDRLLILTLTKLKKEEALPYHDGDDMTYALIAIQESRPSDDLEPKARECFDALINLREILTAPQKAQVQQYLSQAKIAAQRVKEFFTTLDARTQTHFRDYVLYDIKQLKKMHKDFKP
jgi:hypothetical protein